MDQGANRDHGAKGIKGQIEGSSGSEKGSRSKKGSAIKNGSKEQKKD